MTLYTYTLPHRLARRWLAAGDQEARERFLAVNVREAEDEFVLSALVPGLRADDLRIQVLEDMLRIDGKFPADEDEYLMQELPSGSFRRELRLPSAVDSDKVEAKIADGVLTLRLPKAESAKPKKIKIDTI